MLSPSLAKFCQNSGITPARSSNGTDSVKKSFRQVQLPLYIEGNISIYWFWCSCSSAQFDYVLSLKPQYVIISVLVTGAPRSTFLSILENSLRVPTTHSSSESAHTASSSLSWWDLHDGLSCAPWKRHASRFCGRYSLSLALSAFGLIEIRLI